MIRDYKDLQIWQKSVELIKEIYNTTKQFPKSEIFGLVNQMRRSAVSIPSNIAEGWMRQHTKEYIQFLYHALGSCGELDTQVIIACKLGYMNNETSDNLCNVVNSLIRVIRTLIKKLHK